MNDSIGLYLNEIGKVPLLTAEEERSLSRVIEAGHEAAERIAAGETGTELARAVTDAAAAKDRFIRANLRLVVSIARRYPLPQGMDLGDLVQEGNLGLEHAVDKFDWRRGFKFSTYATFWIRQAIGRALDQKASLVRLPGDRSASLRAALRRLGGRRPQAPGPLTPPPASGRPAAPPAPPPGRAPDPAVTAPPSRDGGAASEAGRAPSRSAKNAQPARLMPPPGDQVIRL